MLSPRKDDAAGGPALELDPPTRVTSLLVYWVHIANILCRRTGPSQP